MPPGPLARLRRGAAAHLAEPQHRNAYCLLLNNVLGAATGLLFWLLFARVMAVPPAEVGVGYALVALGTTVAVLAKGGLDTALLRALPSAGSGQGPRLFRFALAAGVGTALSLALALAAASRLRVLPLDAAPTGWLLVAAIAVLLVVTWLQDARFLASGDAAPTLKRNAVLGAARIALPLPVLALALPRPVALSWALALGLSAGAGLALARALPDPSPPPAGSAPVPSAPSGPSAASAPADGRRPPNRRRFLATALRNASGGAAEFLPGLVLAPIVLAAAGAEAAAYFGMAWTAASLLFLASAALARSALAEMVRRPHDATTALRRAAVQHAFLVLPAAAVAAALAPQALAFFGSAYAAAGQTTLALLAVSTVLVAPGNLYLATLRARDAPVALAALPAAMIAVLLALSPPLLGAWGLPGVAWAWMAANLPLGLAGLWHLRRAARPAPQPAGGAA